ncbi:hypothetical protein [Thiobacillus denitrificans]|uniref:hypothetical protein n=1 Tax=Thiobacillus denitrificans TaxID=36861 RepID=UPI000ACCB008|nr:hypothetical protein [Thiobacillus denitrificans]
MEEIGLSKQVVDALIDKSSKKQIAETARLLAVTLAYCQQGKKPHILRDIHNSICNSSLSTEDKTLVSEGINALARTLNFVHETPQTGQISKDIFQHEFIDMAEVFSTGCEQILEKYKPHDYAIARNHLISLVSDKNAKKTYENWWAPFKRAWFRGEGEKFISIVRKNRVADHGKLAGKTGIKAALSEYVAGTGKK